MSTYTSAGQPNGVCVCVCVCVICAPITVWCTPLHIPCTALYLALVGTTLYLALLCATLHYLVRCTTVLPCTLHYTNLHSLYLALQHCTTMYLALLCTTFHNLVPCTTMWGGENGTWHSDGIQWWWTTQEKEEDMATLRMLGNKHEANEGAVVDLMLASYSSCSF